MLIHNNDFESLTRKEDNFFKSSLENWDRKPLNFIAFTNFIISFAK